MLACSGLSASEIGARLDKKELTVRSHLKEVYERLQVSSRAELVWVLEADRHPWASTIGKELPRERTTEMIDWGADEAQSGPIRERIGR